MVLHLMQVSQDLGIWVEGCTGQGIRVGGLRVQGFCCLGAVLAYKVCVSARSCADGRL